MARPSSGRRMSSCLVAFLLVGTSVWVPLSGQNQSETEPSQTGIESSLQPSSGQGPDSACQPCHSDLYQAFQETGKAGSFFRPKPDRTIEDFSKLPYTHVPSNQYYELVWKESALWFRRYLRDPSGEAVLAFEVEVDWILGSGTQVRNYLYQTPLGELFQLPLAWYAEPDGWAITAGYDNPYHPGVLKSVGRDCLFCHNAYPDYDVGSDRHGAPHRFPTALPEGIGCQRCHGPTASHVEAARNGDVPIQDSMLKLSQLPPARRREVCNQCHYQPSRLIAGIRRFGRGDYSYQPGQELSSYRLEVDVDEEGKLREERFEINHHAYRLEQSACFLQSDDELECIACHDPHRKVNRQPEHYRNVCLSCHDSQDKACSRSDGGVSFDPAQDEGNCVSCHMPKRRAQDVVRALVTDHRIQRASGIDWTRQLRETSSAVTSVEIVGGTQLSDAERRVYSSVASTRLLTEAEPVSRLHGLLSTFPAEQPEPYHDLALGLVRVRRYDQAKEILQLLQSRWPDFPLTKDWLALVESISGRSVQAVELLRAAVAESQRPESIFNLARLLAGGGVLDEARSLFEEAVRLRPGMQSAEFQIGRMLMDQAEFGEAEKHFLRSLSMDPLYARSYLGLAEALFEQNKIEEAIAWLRLGEGLVRQADTISQQIRILRAELP